MCLIRRHLRVCVAIWALGQSAVLTGLLSRDCCAAHLPGAHETAVSANAEAAAPPACPMEEHTAEAGAHPVTAADPVRGDGSPGGPAGDTRCALRPACEGPLAALASFLSGQGITPDAVIVAADQMAALLPPARDQQPRAIPAVPDSPPPRA